ncbi:MAG: hypothetical protein ACOC9W_01115 [Persicimonas sp.]
MDRDRATCSAELSDQLVDELRLRTSAQVLSLPPDSEERDEWTITLNAADDESCEISLEQAEDASSFVVAPDADQLEVASFATRLAWIIDGVRPPEAMPQPEAESEPVEQEPVEQEPVEQESVEQESVEQEPIEQELVVQEPSEPASADISGEISAGADASSAPVVTLEAVAGAMWIPSADAGLKLVRVGAGWKPWSRVKLGLVGRLPVDAAQSEVQGVRFSYRPWSAELTAAYARRFSAGWSFTAGGGARWTVAEVWAQEVSGGVIGDRLPGAAGTLTGEPDTASQNALSPWSLVASAGAGYSFNPMLAVRLDATAAASLADRKVRDSREVVGDREIERIVMDLGRFEFDMLLGLELGF